MKAGKLKARTGQQPHCPRAASPPRHCTVTAQLHPSWASPPPSNRRKPGCMGRSEGSRAASALQQPLRPSLLEAYQPLLHLSPLSSCLSAWGVPTPTCGPLGSCIQTQVRGVPFLDFAPPPPACLAHSLYLVPPPQLYPTDISQSPRHRSALPLRGRQEKCSTQERSRGLGVGRGGDRRDSARQGCTGVLGE